MLQRNFIRVISDKLLMDSGSGSDASETAATLVERAEEAEREDSEPRFLTSKNW
eukprot:CAMPEP_0202942952 /NCGR_PEP_ID=MMETSP1395-20130829/3186_1 /ASSEMBLY_ACC=CAM_ASM_000871 /TAXON_ID=5961 /ORGANISM="Blepharisma japonicum, Strain Stock R1072" /LENGTH=53 /DNA_ID=CAMNT_0049639759 /DNA_START=2698 /DNA_END=2856 /DNA_ORIENTATION=-